LQDLASTFQAELDRHRLVLKLKLETGLPPLEADEGLLFRAVGNLLSNACKFSPEGTEILISVRTTTMAENEEIGWSGLAIDVTNEGPGLDPDEVPEIFERFRRGHAQGSIEGSGLGAYVVKSITEAHGGKVTVESVPNGLTTFSLCLPLRVL
jgi:signal transduction histidine kinase